MQLAHQELQEFSCGIQISLTLGYVLASPNFVVHLIAHSDTGSYEYIG